MRVLALGLGRVGLLTTRLLSELVEGLQVVGADADPSKGEYLKSLGRYEFIKVKEPTELRHVLGSVDLALVALPSSTAFKYLRYLVSKCVDVVDVSFISEDPYSLEDRVRECGTTYVPDAGFAPGFSNLLVGYASGVLGGLRDVAIYVGGVPKEPVPPIGYVVTWSAEDLIEEYVRPARVVKGGKVVEVDPLSEVGKVVIEGLGEVEWFTSDGLRTLLRNVRADNMVERTVRWPRHVAVMKALRDLGLMSGEEVLVGGVKVRPKDLLAHLLETKLRARVPDVAVLEVIARGPKGAFRGWALMEGRPRESATAKFAAAIMAYTTYLVLKGRVAKGIQPLELLWRELDGYVKYLRSLGAKVTVTTSVE